MAMEDLLKNSGLWKSEYGMIKKDTGVQLRMSRSNCIYNIVSLLNEGAITMEDLEEFSDELKERVHFIAK